MREGILRNKRKCIVVMLSAFCLWQVSAAQCGDVNSSGGIDIVDALVIAQYYVGLNPSNFDSGAADVNGDNSVSIVDALYIARYYVGLLPLLSCTTATQPPACTAGPTPVAVNVSFTGNAFTGSHQVVVETDPGLSGYTVYRPEDLGEGKRYPIAVWGNGGCSLNGTYNPEFLGEIASNGYLVVSDGTPNGSGSRSMGSDVRSMGAPMVTAIDWAVSENDNPCSQYYRSLDSTKTAVFGWSCGGLMSLGASNDPRLTTFIIDSSGLMSADSNIYNGIHTPMLIVLGGPDDIAYSNGTRDYQNVNNVPIVCASTPVGHGGTYTQDNGGSFAKVNLYWFNWQLKGDTGATGKAYFAGSSCGLCATANWTVQSKNIQ